MSSKHLRLILKTDLNLKTSKEKEMTVQNETYMVRNAIALYPRIDRTYRFDSGEGRSVSCAPTEEGAVYELQFKIPKEEAQKLYKSMVAAYAAKREKSWPEKLEMPFTKDDEGLYIGKAKLKGAYSGQLTAKPKQYDAKNQELPEDFQLTSGSTVHVMLSMTPYFVKGNVGNGVALRLRAVQVINYVERVAASPFAVEEGFTLGDASPFADESTPAPEAVKTEVTSEDDPFAEDDSAPVEEPKLKVVKKEPAPKEEDDALKSLVDEWDD